MEGYENKAGQSSKPSQTTSRFPPFPPIRFPVLQIKGRDRVRGVDGGKGAHLVGVFVLLLWVALGIIVCCVWVLLFAPSFCLASLHVVRVYVCVCGLEAAGQALEAALAGLSTEPTAAESGDAIRVVNMRSWTKCSCARDGRKGC